MSWKDPTKNPTPAERSFANKLAEFSNSNKLPSGCPGLGNRSLTHTVCEFCPVANLCALSSRSNVAKEIASKLPVIGYFGPDWHLSLSKHVAQKGAFNFVTALREVGCDMFKVLRVTSLEEVQACDAVILFHHNSWGMITFDNPLYQVECRRIISALPDLKLLKMLWHVEPYPTFESISRSQLDDCDLVLTSSVLSMFGSKPVIYIPNGVDTSIPKPAKKRFASANMSLVWFGKQGEANFHGGRDAVLRQYVFDKEVYIFGDSKSWKQTKLGPNWHLRPTSLDGSSFRDYTYTLECTPNPNEHRRLNAIGYLSDRVGLAVANWCHLVTNLSWVKYAYKSVITWDELPNHVPNEQAIIHDRQVFSWQTIVRNRLDLFLQVIILKHSNSPLSIFRQGR